MIKNTITYRKNEFTIHVKVHISCYFWKRVAEFVYGRLVWFKNTPTTYKEIFTTSREVGKIRIESERLATTVEIEKRYV